MRKLLLLLFLLPVAALASPDIIQSNDNNAQTTGDVVNEIGGSTSRAYGFSHALGDVDINQCLGSTQWGSILVSKQKLVLNKWCAAEVFDAKHMHSMAARLRCQIPEISNLFDTALGCISENTYTPSATPIPTPGPDEDGYRPDEAGDISEWGDSLSPGLGIVQQQIAIQAEEYETLEQRIARIENGNRIAARKAQERRNYAQMTIERLDNDPEE